MNNITGFVVIFTVEILRNSAMFCVGLVELVEKIFDNSGENIQKGLILVVTN